MYSGTNRPAELNTSISHPACNSAAPNAADARLGQMAARSSAHRTERRSYSEPGRQRAKCSNVTWSPGPDDVHCHHPRIRRVPEGIKDPGVASRQADLLTPEP